MEINYFTYGPTKYERNKINESIFENFECNNLFPSFYYFYVENGKMNKTPISKSACVFYQNDVEITKLTHPEYFI